MCKELTFEQFDSLKESEFTKKIQNEYVRYAFSDQTFEQWFYGNIKWVNEEFKKEFKECPTCNGKGEAVFSCCTGEVVNDDIQLCPSCHEHLGEEQCQDCEGKGYVPEDQKEFTDIAPSLQAQAEAYQDEQKYGNI